MSAGGLTYSGIVGYGKATLPSVDGWGTNLNILRDPPKSIMTRKIDKVGETSELNTMIDQAGDRACEAIMVYPRGVNPFVGVSYGAGNNGGQGFGVNTNLPGNIKGLQARLPYAITDAFRPPVRPPQDLIPLSRLPRTTTSSFSKPGFPNFAKQVMCPSTGDILKGIKADTIQGCVRPTAVYKMEKVEPFVPTQMIKDPLHFSAGSGVRTMNITSQEVKQPSKGINRENFHYDAYANRNRNIHVSNSEMDTQPYIQDPLHYDVQSKPSQNIGTTPIADVMSNVYTKETFNIPYRTPLKGYNKNEYLHDVPQLQKVLPSHEAITNRGLNIQAIPTNVQDKQLEPHHPTTSMMSNIQRNQGIDTITSRQARITPTVNPGAFTGRSNIPSQRRAASVPYIDTQRQTLNRRVMEMQQARVRN